MDDKNPIPIESDISIKQGDIVLIAGNKYKVQKHEDFDITVCESCAFEDRCTFVDGCKTLMYLCMTKLPTRCNFKEL